MAAFFLATDSLFLGDELSIECSSWKLPDKGKLDWFKRILDYSWWYSYTITNTWYIHTKHCLVPFTSHDICTCKVWSCYAKQFRNRCIYKKIHYLTFDLGINVTCNVAQYPIHHVAYVPAKFEVATSNGLGDAFIRKYIIWLLTLTLGQCHAKHCLVPFASLGLSCTCKVWSCYVQRFRRSCIYKKIHYLAFDLDPNRPWPQSQGHRSIVHYLLHHVAYAPAKFVNLLRPTVKEEMYLFTRNMTEARTDQLWYEINIPFL